MTILLKKDLDRSLEIRCDLTVAQKLSGTETAEYLNTIVTVVKRLSKGKKQKMIQDGVCLAKESGDELLERFQIVQKNNLVKSGNKKTVRIWVTAFILIMILSYTVTFYPSYDTLIEEIEDAPGDYALTRENAYIIQRGDKYYMVEKKDGVETELPEEATVGIEDSGFAIIREDEN